VFHVRYELDFYIPEDGFLHSPAIKTSTLTTKTAVYVLKQMEVVVYDLRTMVAEIGQVLHKCITMIEGKSCVTEILTVQEHIPH
jgi:hypothetical protein